MGAHAAATQPSAQILMDNVFRFVSVTAIEAVYVPVEVARNCRYRRIREIVGWHDCAVAIDGRRRRASGSRSVEFRACSDLSP